MDLVDAILKDRPSNAPGEQARHVVEIIEKSLMSVQTGQSQMMSSSF
jgi:hypothetical protein